MKRFEKTESDLYSEVCRAVDSIRKVTDFVPQIAIVLGTGLGDLVQKFKNPVAIDYAGIEHFPVSTVESHVGKLVFGELAGKKIVAMQGRFHFYEGYTMREVAFPIRVMKQLGAEILVVLNAAGGLDLSYRKGEIVIIEDHINLMGDNPLIGTNEDRLGSRFPDMAQPYTARLAGLAEEAAREEKIPVRRGVYLAISGPNLETRAEYRMMRMLGADLVGMSTVPEVIAGVHMDMQILGLSVVTDLCDPDHLHPVDIKDIIKTANEAGPRLDRLLEAVVKKI
ncbi:MAG: purine-nucleoside phosphorylase [Candidatus Omnitrophica bacterium]|nr:purine-nucleoside phosphorylase [Candidatus Omnitrophota bacterium]